MDNDSERAKTHEDYAVGTVLVEDGEDYDREKPHHVKFSWRMLWLYTGPGWLMSMVICRSHARCSRPRVFHAYCC
jgi:hypothetical protein